MIRGLLSFDRFLFPRIAWWVHLIGFIAILISMVVGIVSGVVIIGAGKGDTAAGLFMIAGTIVGTIVSIIVWRMIIELWMVAFSIDSNLRAIRQHGLPK
ncbi:DUF4282 domain-containing protein [Mesorhizobium xinjiangense]|uniref:DUF4282 domain-containing protein n=1 Tax=Mesorhizobium xinjiangense TaxID=2678685 RepID=UPI0012EEC170|nr:DUF4282 domain-containing protein [Mesorhizobium xinjiangense]